MISRQRYGRCFATLIPSNKSQARETTPVNQSAPLKAGLMLAIFRVFETDYHGAGRVRRALPVPHRFGGAVSENRSATPQVTLGADLRALVHGHLKERRRLRLLLQRRADLARRTGRPIRGLPPARHLALTQVPWRR